MLQFTWTQEDNSTVRYENIINLINKKFIQSPSDRLAVNEIRSFFESALGVLIPPHSGKWKCIIQALREELHLTDRKIHKANGKGYIYGIRFKH